MPCSRLLADPEPQTILELIRVLTDDAFREPYTAKLDDPLLASFWATEWPSPAGRENDNSIKAVLNKLGAFVSYDSIRDVVGQGEVDYPAASDHGQGRPSRGRLLAGRRRQRPAVRGDVHQSLLRRRDRATGNADATSAGSTSSSSMRYRPSIPKPSGASSTKAASLASLWSPHPSRCGVWASACATRC